VAAALSGPLRFIEIGATIDGSEAVPVHRLGTEAIVDRST
jgi:hypothetical protein